VNILFQSLAVNLCFSVSFVRVSCIPKIFDTVDCVTAPCAQVLGPLYLTSRNAVYSHDLKFHGAGQDGISVWEIDKLADA
jgi:hypothetical protein